MAPQPGGPAYQGDLQAGVGPAPGQTFGEEGLAGARSAGAKHPRIRLRHVGHAHLILGQPLDAPPGVLHPMEQSDGFFSLAGIHLRAEQADGFFSLAGVHLRAEQSGSFFPLGGVHLRAQIPLKPRQCAIVIVGPAFPSCSCAPVVEQAAQPAFEVAAATRIGEHRGVPLGAVAPPFAVRKHHPVARGEPVEHVFGQIGAQVFHQSVKRRLRLAERTLLGQGDPAVAVPVPPHAVVARHPPALDLDGVQAIGTADDEIDLGEPFTGMPGRLQGVEGRVAIVEGGAQSLEYPFLAWLPVS